MKLYLAGGAVRDLLLGNPIADRDYLVMDSTIPEFESLFPNAQKVGRAFPIYLIDKIEFSFPRASTIEEELRARDLTVNAMLLDEDGNLYCHDHALEDLHSRTLRPASKQSFIEDPLRVFRAARFWAKFPNFTPHEHLIKTMRSVADQDLIRTILPDRIGQETQKAMASQAPGNYLRLLAMADCLSPWFNEFKDSLHIPAGPIQYHSTNVLEHTCRMMDALAGDAQAVWMAFCHDLGKTLTPKDLLPKHHGHDQRGVILVEQLSKRIRMSNQHIISGKKASKWHMIAGKYLELRPGTKVDLLMDIHFARVLEPFFKLVTADQGCDYSMQAKEDLLAILPVSLPIEWQSRGGKSGIRLREMRAKALSGRTKK